VLIETMEHGADVPGTDRTKIAAHVEKCPVCQTELSLYRGFEAGEVQADEREAVDHIVGVLRGRAPGPARLPEQKPSRSWWSGVAEWLTPGRMGGFAVAAAALLLTVGVGLQWQARRGASEPVGEADVTRSAVIRGVIPQGEVAEFPAEFRWDAVPGAAAYTVTLSEVDRNVIFHNTFTTPVLEVPVNVRRLVVPGKTVLLQIQATDREGREIAQSGTTRVSVRAEQAQPK